MSKMKKSKVLSHNDIVILQHEYASGNFKEDADYIMSLMTKIR